MKNKIFFSVAVVLFAAVSVINLDKVQLNSPIGLSLQNLLTISKADDSENGQPKYKQTIPVEKTREVYKKWDASAKVWIVVSIGTSGSIKEIEKYTINCCMGTSSNICTEDC